MKITSLLIAAVTVAYGIAAIIYLSQRKYEQFLIWGGYATANVGLIIVDLK